MNLEQITALQKENGFSEIQEQINSGLAWKWEGSAGRYAMHLLGTGACMLPKEACFDAYGSRVPARTDLKEGTKGTFQNSVNFWNKVEAGEVEL